MTKRFTAALALTSATLFLGTAHADDGYRFLRIGNHDVKWGQSQFGAGTSLSYAFAERPRTYNDVRNCRNVGPIDPLLAHANLPRDVIESELVAAFAMWESVADVHFHQAADAASADIVIGADMHPGGIAFADITAGAIAGPLASINKGIVCLNPERSWHPDSAEAALGSENGSYNLRYTFAHEIGHVLGLDHASSHGELMGTVYDSANRALKAGDIAGAVALYGAARKADGAPASAAGLIASSADSQR